MEKLQKNDDIRRKTRIIQIDEMLRGGSYVKIASLVRKFGVSQRTVERDFERLRDDLNAPLEYDKSKNMYHYTDPTFSVPNVILTEGELFTVSALLPLMEQYKNTPLESSFKNIMKSLLIFCRTRWVSILLFWIRTSALFQTRSQKSTKTFLIWFLRL